MLSSGRRLQQAQTILVVLPSFVLFGYNLSGVGGLLSIGDFASTFPAIDTVHTVGTQHNTNSTVQGVVVATLTLGALAGSLACTWIGDVLGRRKTAFLAGLCTLIGEILQCTSFQLPQFVIGRFVVGLGVGALSTSVPVWQSECSEAKNRGRHVVIDGVFICVGYFLQSWINLGFFQIKQGSLSWRMPLAIPCVISAVLLSSIFMFPESPRWLAKRGSLEHARSNLAKLRGLPVGSVEIASEMSGIEVALEETTGANRKRDLFVMGEHKLFYRFTLSMVLQLLQQWCGTNLISVYSTVIFQQGLGLDSQTSRILSGGMLTWKLCSSFAAFFTIDRFGRRKLFMVSGTGMSMCMLALAVATSFPKSNLPAQVASVIFVFLFNFFVPIGFLGCNYLYVTEIAPSRLRMPMTSFSTANHWLWNFAILMITPIAVDTIGYQYYILYTIMGACIPILVYFLFPETMGRSLEQMEDLFKENTTIRGVVRESLQAPISWEDAEAKAISKGRETLHKESVSA